ncbi:acetaldehyde dehydrogenase (acetylating) [Francisellaceae bacterium CB300]
MKSQILRAAIIGTGNIGTDILAKLELSRHVKCVLFIGRREESKGIEVAKSLGVRFSINGSSDLEKYSNDYDIIFDATSAFDHSRNNEIAKRFNKKIIDLTPSKLGQFCVPVINNDDILNYDNISMITCGGQVATPIAYAMSKSHKAIKNIEVVSSISSKSAGAATRDNIDQYILATESAVIKFSGCLEAKAILNVNPAVPHISMKTTIFAEISNPDMDSIRKNVLEMVRKVQEYVPGYKLLVEPIYDGEKVIAIVEVKGAGDYLPIYAGNLDIITAAAVQVAENISQFS